MKKVMRNKRVIAVMAVVVLAVALLGNGVIASSTADSDDPPVANKINYQGQLTDNAGNPLNGTYDMDFQLWDAPTGGSQVGYTMTTNNVTVANGLFSVELLVNTSHFNGQGLWLQVIVEGETLSPRQEILPVPYALSLRPGANIIGDESWSGPVLYVNYKGIGYGGIGRGMVVEASNTGDVQNCGGYFASAGGLGTGVYGKATNTGEFAINYGGFFYASGGRGRGVFGQAEGVSGIGVEGCASNDGPGTNYGGHFTASGEHGIGVYGKAESTLGGRGGYFESVGTAGTGMYAKASNTAGDAENRGVWGDSFGGQGSGVYGFASGEFGKGVYGWAIGDSGQAIRGEADGEYGQGGVFVAYGTHGKGIYAEGYEYAADLVGNVIIRSYSSGNPVVELGEGLDYAEGFDVSNGDGVVPGTVLIIDPDNPGKLTVSCQPYDTKVAGIVAGANEMGSGVRLGGQFDYDVALAGRVYCNVDAMEAGVEPGDLLTTSAIPGYAMKVTDYDRAQGAILGKAMERLEKGSKGQILVLVTLQ